MYILESRHKMNIKIKKIFMSFMVLLMVLTIPVEVFAQEKTNVKGTIKQETRENKDISSRQKRS